MSKNNVFQNLFFLTTVFENLTKMFKTDLYREKIDIKKKELNSLSSLNLDLPQKKHKEKIILQEIKTIRARLERAETCNCEVTKDFQKMVSDFDVEEFVLDNADLFFNFSKLVLEVPEQVKNIKTLSIIPSVLVEVENENEGTISINDKYYKMIL